MPCDSGMSSGPGWSDLRRVQDETNKVTRLLCELLRGLEAQGIDLPVSGELARWWAEHKRHDEENGRGGNVS